MTIDLDPALRTEVWPWMVVTSDRAFSPERAIEIKRELGNKCHGIDPWNNLEVCAVQVIGVRVDGRIEHKPASKDLGFNIDLSHEKHGRGWRLRSSPEGVTCQCLACHMLYSLGIGQRGGRKGDKKWGAVAINERFVYTDRVRSSSGQDFHGLDFSLRRPKDVLNALRQELYIRGVRWTYGKDVYVPEDWTGYGRRSEIVDIARRLYAPDKYDTMNWEAQIAQNSGIVYEAADRPFDPAIDLYEIR